MSGFGSVIGFAFTFFLIVGAFTSVFILYTNQLDQQISLLEATEKQSKLNLNQNFEIFSPYYSSGRLNLLINNTGDDNLKFRENGEVCYSAYFNGQYIKKNFTNANIFRDISTKYSIIEPNSLGFFSLKMPFNNSINNIIKLFSCDDNEKILELNSEKYNWWDNNWEKRQIFNASNSASEDLAEYQVEVIINSSYENFNALSEEDLRFLLPLQENIILDLTFDNYNQNLNDYSKYSLSSTLGTTAISQASDPSISEGVIGTALQFDGTQDYVNIAQSEFLEVEEAITISSWFKWDGDGPAKQTIFSNGYPSNSLSIINDGGVNDNKILFELNISGTLQTVYSNITINNNWNHVVGVYDGYELKVYLNSELVGNQTAIGKIVSNSSNNLVGLSGTTSYYKGLIDEIKIFDIPLTNSEIEDLYFNNLRFRELDYYISDYDTLKEEIRIFVKIPSLRENSYTLFEMYYDNSNSLNSTSNIENTFSYLTPRKIGYVISNKSSNDLGISILSLTNDNIINIGTNTYELDEQESDTLASGSLEINTSIYSKSLVQVEGNGNGGDIIVPISWAGTEFSYRGMRNNLDMFCLLSPWGDSTVNIRENGALEWTGTINSTGTCINSINIETGNNLFISSVLPILVASYGDTSDDSFSFYPATNEDLFGVPSGSFYLAGSFNSGGTYNIFQSDGTVSSSTFGAYGTLAINSDPETGSQGEAYAFRINSNSIMGALQQGDGDGAESSIFAPLKEHGTKFGSGINTDYIVMASKYPDANCSVYTSTGILIENQTTGVGTTLSGVYYYGFDEGTSDEFAAANWKMECDKPVWPYYERASGDETSLLSYPQMRQYVFPEPTITFLN